MNRTYLGLFGAPGNGFHGILFKAHSSQEDAFNTSSCLILLLGSLVYDQDIEPNARLSTA